MGSGTATCMRCCIRGKLVCSPSNATISPSATKSSSGCPLSASVSSGYVRVISFWFLVSSRTPDRSRNARQRSPSSFRSNSQPGSENRSLVSVASIGSTQPGSGSRDPVPLIAPRSARRHRRRPGQPPFAMLGP